MFKHSQIISVVEESLRVLCVLRTVITEELSALLRFHRPRATPKICLSRVNPPFPSAHASVRVCARARVCV